MWRLYKRNSSLNSFNSQKPERKRNLNEESTCGSTGLSEWTPTFTCKIKKNRLAAHAANNFPARRQYWQRALPISSPPAANNKSGASVPLKRGLIPAFRHFFPRYLPSFNKSSPFSSPFSLSGFYKISCGYTYLKI